MEDQETPIPIRGPAILRRRSPPSASPCTAAFVQKVVGGVVDVGTDMVRTWPGWTSAQRGGARDVRRLELTCGAKGVWG
ncbi:hypothetical protein ES332_A02G182700v1 [Gossypium tomentosum]|uniref:Uncharacterized protein n=1 Tax=Gossypium tomentosum TaxID=34277 RepID=A0A5D2RLL2_GOSTO|nr:hypothetical protein ES332_A02G182700v1 [Gossypium tomentosum]